MSSTKENDPLPRVASVSKAHIREQIVAKAIARRASRSMNEGLEMMLSMQDDVNRFFYALDHWYIVRDMLTSLPCVNLGKIELRSLAIRLDCIAGLLASLMPMLRDTFCKMEPSVRSVVPMPVVWFESDVIATASTASGFVRNPEMDVDTVLNELKTLDTGKLLTELKQTLEEMDALDHPALSLERSELMNLDLRHMMHATLTSQPNRLGCEFTQVAVSIKTMQILVDKACNILLRLNLLY